MDDSYTGGNYGFDASFGNCVCGIDEAGRGCLAGDVFAAAVILSSDKHIKGLDDSKKLTPTVRERLYDEIIGNCAAYGIATASVAEIEQINILQAALLAMKRAYEQLQLTVTEPHIILVDGNIAPPITAQNVKCIVSGDAKSAAIAAASVLAKVSRDRYMRKLGEEYPQYLFEKHKGYATKIHREMILKYGASPVHRLSFLGKILS